MNRQYEQLLGELFDTLDEDASGFLDVRAFAVLGEAITGRPVTTEEAKLQLDRADADGDEMVSRQEWLEFSLILNRLDSYQLTRLVSNYLEKVKAIKARTFEVEDS